MSDRNTRNTCSAMAWLFAVLCSIALLTTAAAVAENSPQPVAKSSQP